MNVYCLQNCSRFCGCFFLLLFCFSARQIAPFPFPFFACSPWNFLSFSHPFFPSSHAVFLPLQRPIFFCFPSPFFSVLPTFFPFSPRFFRPLFAPFFRQFFTPFYANFPHFFPFATLAGILPFWVIFDRFRHLERLFEYIFR